MRCVLVAILAAAWAGPAPAAVHAVLPACCTDMLGWLSVMDADTGKIEGQFSTGEIDGFGYDWGVAFTKDARRAAVFSNEYPAGPQSIGISFIELNTGKIAGTVATPNAIGGGSAVNSKSGLVYATYTYLPTFAGHLQEVDPASLTVLRDIESDCIGIAVSPDGERIYCTTTTGIGVLQADTLSPIGTIAIAGGATYLTFSPDGSVLYASSPGPNNVEFVDTATLQVTQSVAVGSYFFGPALSPDASELYLPTLTSILVLNTGTLNISTIPVAPGVGMAISPDGTLYWITGSNLVLFDPVSQTITTTYPAPEGANQFAIDSSGSRLCFLAADYVSTISITGAVPSQSVLRSISAAFGPFQGVYDRQDNLVFLPDSLDNIEILDADTLHMHGYIPLQAYVVAGEGGGYAVSGAEVDRFDPVSLAVTASVSLPGGGFFQPALADKYLYVPFAGSESNGVAVVDLETMQVTATFPFEFDNIYGFAVIPSIGKGYLSVLKRYADYRLIEFDLTTGWITRTTSIAGGYGGTIAASPDGSTIYLVEGVLYAIDARTLEVTNSLTTDFLNSVGISPDGQFIYGSWSTTGALCPCGFDIISTSSLTVVGRIASATRPSPAIFVDN